MGVSGDSLLFNVQRALGSLSKMSFILPVPQKEEALDIIASHIRIIIFFLTGSFHWLSLANTRLLDAAETASCPSGNTK